MIHRLFLKSFEPRQRLAARRRRPDRRSDRKTTGGGEGEHNTEKRLRRRQFSSWPAVGDDASRYKKTIGAE